MQILHPFFGSVQQYFQGIAEPDHFRPDHCPQCDATQPLTTHGFYSRTLVDIDFDGSIRIRRYLCHACKRTVSLLPEFTLPYIRFGITVIALFLATRLLLGRTLAAAAIAAKLLAMPYQRGQFWIRRFRSQAERLCAALAALIAPPAAPYFVTRALGMLQSVGWIAAHRFLFAELRVHLLGWHADYVAEYSWGDRVTAVFFTILCGGLLCFFLIRGGHFRSTAISAALFCGMAYCTLEVTGTRVRFTDQGFIARVSWFRHVSARYADIRRVSGKPRSVKIEFSDGQSLKFHPGLGDPDKVIAYLQARCPESVEPI